MLIVLILHVHMFYRIEAESVQPETHPIKRNIQYRIAYRLIIEIQFGHTGIETRKIVISVRIFEPLLRRPSGFRHGIFVPPIVEITVVDHFQRSVRHLYRFFYKFLRFDKPRIWCRCMLKHKIHQHFHAAFMCFIYEFPEILDRSETRIDSEIIFDIISVVGIWLLERSQP